MNERAAIDVSPLPTFAFGHRSTLWWGTMGIIAIEGTMFALLCATYLYLRWRVPDWPPGVAEPALLWGSLQAVVLLASLVPNQLAKSAAERLDLRRVQLWLLVCCAIGVVFVVVRVFEFMSLNVRWDSNAYGSIVWVLLGAHTAHVLTDVADTMVLTVLMFTGPLDGKRYVDVSENAMYWYFVVLSWLPIYGFIYLAPRIL